MLNVPLAMECVRASASWFIEKPFNREQLLEAIHKGGAPFTVPRRESDPPHLFSPPSEPSTSFLFEGDGDQSLDSVKRNHVRRVFDSSGGDYAEAAGKLRIAQSTLRRILARDRRNTE
jgi:DNA-binding NtrC family response regulator